MWNVCGKGWFRVKEEIKVKINKELFITCIESMRDVWDYQRESVDLINKYNPYSQTDVIDYPSCDNELLTLLVEVMKDHGELISYFCYEIDFGREWKVGCVTDTDGTDIPLGTIEDLWNALNK